MPFNPIYPESRDQLRQRISIIVKRGITSLYTQVAADSLTLLDHCERLGESHNRLQDERDKLAKLNAELQKEREILYTRHTQMQEYSQTQLDEIRAQRRELETIKIELAKLSGLKK